MIDKTACGSVVFTRLRQCAHPSGTLQSASAPYRFCPLLSRFVSVYRPPDMSERVLSRPLLPSKLPSRVWGSGPPSNTWFLEPTRVHIPNGSTIGSTGRDRLTNRQTDRPTDRSRYYIFDNRQHLASAAMRPNNNK